jgi:hypothetical protein
MTIPLILPINSNNGRDTRALLGDRNYFQSHPFALLAEFSPSRTGWHVAY